MIKYRKRNDGLYVCTEAYTYRSPRYGKSVVIAVGQVRDGASGGIDIRSLSWWVHDELCASGVFADGTPVTAWQAATILRDILRSEGRWARAFYWRWATFFFGCKRPRANGWIK